MKGDFSRIRFNPEKHYSAVLEQQGRVSLDVDANEQSAIYRYLRDTTNIDVIGPCGGPVGDAGFALEIDGAQIFIDPGRYYVDGILVENPSQISYDDQPTLLGPTYSAFELLDAVFLGKGQVVAQLWLEVWERLVTDLDDPCLQEPALGQADTTVRLQTVWRVVGTIQNVPSSQPVPVDNNPTRNALINKQTINKQTDTQIPVIAEASGNTSSGPSNYAVSQLSPCCQALYNPQVTVRSGGLSAATNPASNDCGCQPIPSAGYQGLENQLYRVEIQTGGNLDAATFKWSRENASVVVQVTNISGAVVTVSSLGPDPNLGFQNGQWVELSDDTYQFGEPANQAGMLYQIQSIQQSTLQVTMTTAVSGIDKTKNARMRRWDQSGAAATSQGIAVSSTAIPLENGIEVTFQSGYYQPGDYWTIPARTANGQIDWPPQANGSLFRPAKYIKIHTAPLACIHGRSFWDRNQADSEESVVGAASQQYDNGLFLVDDCRLLFPPLTDLNADVEAEAVHVSATSWLNDDVMTVDALLQNGLSITFDQAPTSPWGGGNFRVTLEVPFQADPLAPLEGKIPGLPAPGNYPPGTDVYARTETVLDPPLGITVSGNQVNWLAPSTNEGQLGFYGSYFLWAGLNAALKSTGPLGFARVRVKLYGAGVYASGQAGNIYLDGQSFGETGARTADGSPCVSLTMPSGNSLKVSDYESWFYLAPTLLITNVTIQLLNGTDVVGTNAVTVGTNFQNPSSGMTVTGSNPTTPVTAIQAVITLSYPPVAQSTLTLTLSGPGIGTVVTIQGSATVSLGQASVNVPISILGNPGIDPSGAPVVDTVTLAASISSLFYNVPASQQPTLAISGSTPPIE